jgi:alpha-amylase/alpha-mannosidase (GH57 family)
VTRWVCVHGHFYQPPRENPWLEVIEPQPSAAPYPDWNARITAECYRPNSAARIVDGDGRIVGIVDNYQHMSFNVGPTLMSWLELHAADVHAALIAADRAALARLGHGAAMAQAYGHLILPLASRRDKVTQVRWGVADFRHRFGRAPRGMWLPECAVDVDTLEVLAEEGVAFTVLAPRQAARWRAPGGAWQLGPIETHRVYRCPLPSGRSVDLFFYDGPIAQAVAFERLLTDGGALAERLLSSARGDGLGHIATDGETYGHHHRYGDMALAWALASLGQRAGARLGNYEAFRAAQPATWEVEVVAPSSWSCAHGVGRWRDDCGCNVGSGPDWRQAWRRPLRDALDWLRDRAADVFEAEGALFHDPWAARDAYVEVVLDRQPAVVDRFLASQVALPLTPAVRQRALELLESQRQAMAMFTSCGWFFDDLSGIETVQILRYAARVCELIDRGQVDAGASQRGLLERLAGAHSNLPEHGDGRALWAAQVAPARVDLRHVVAHVALAALVDPARPGAGAAATEVFCYRVEEVDRSERRGQGARLLVATLRATSRLTEEDDVFHVAGVRRDGHPLVVGVRPCGDEVEVAAWARARTTLLEQFDAGDVVGAAASIGQAFAGALVDLSALRAHDGAGVVARLLAEPLAAADAALADVYTRDAGLMRWLVSVGLPVPPAFRAAAEHTLRRRMLRALAAEPPQFPAVRGLIDEAWSVRVDLDTAEIAYAAGGALHRAIDRVIEAPGDVAALEGAARAAEIASRMRSRVDLWHAQNAAWRLADEHLPGWRAAAATDPDAASRLRWLENLTAALRLGQPGAGATRA